MQKISRMKVVVVGKINYLFVLDTGKKIQCLKTIEFA